jgi:hypothetical protein
MSSNNSVQFQVKITGVPEFCLSASEASRLVKELEGAIVAEHNRNIEQSVAANNTEGFTDVFRHLPKKAEKTVTVTCIR